MCKLVEELQKLKKSSNESIDNEQNFSDFKKYMHVKRQVEKDLEAIINLTKSCPKALVLASREFCGISNGSACNSSSYKPSYVLSAMGYDIERIQSSVRLSWGYDSFKENEFISLLSVVKSLQ